MGVLLGDGSRGCAQLLSAGLDRFQQRRQAGHVTADMLIELVEADLARIDTLRTHLGSFSVMALLGILWRKSAMMDWKAGSIDVLWRKREVEGP
ncbi:MAG: hypothetical protein IT537_01810 [Hyphomicrobiales bacterium]|nr:hypothetical protein [Hyphomicrobiales bacterium]